jgi:hypothetical protein
MQPVVASLIFKSRTGGDCCQHRLRFGYFRFKRACGATVPRLEGAFCGVLITIDHLKVRQSPKIEQLGPGIVPVFLPHSKQRNTVINLVIVLPRYSVHSKISSETFNVPAAGGGTREITVIGCP